MFKNLCPIVTHTKVTRVPLLSGHFYICDVISGKAHTCISVSAAFSIMVTNMQKCSRYMVTNPTICAKLILSIRIVAQKDINYHSLKPKLRMQINTQTDDNAMPQENCVQPIYHIGWANMLLFHSQVILMM